MPPINNTTHELDEELYSRQLYVIGHEAMHKMMATTVIIIGLDGLGQEISKNISLAGIRSLTLYDKNPVTLRSLGAGFFFSNGDLGKARDISVLNKLRSLNKYVEINVADEVELDKYNIVVSVNQSMDDNLKISDLCHSKGIKFIMANASGLFSQIFCDFQIHTCIDKNGEPVTTGPINHITTDGLVTLVDGNNHSLSDGDTVKVGDVNYVITVLNRTQFRLRDYSCNDIKIGGDYEEVKVPFNIQFKSLRESLENPEIMDFEYVSINKPKAIHELFFKGKAMEEFKELEMEFLRTRGCLITPICSIVGGIVAQEVIKGASCKFVPIKQFYYFDCCDLYGTGNDDTGVMSRYFDLIKVFGCTGFEKLKRMKIFLVGAGAIGCENLKNFVCCGIGSEGRITVTDMDSIEPSNLNRQFLFRMDDVTKMKSVCAIKRALELNEEYSNERDARCDDAHSDQGSNNHVNSNNNHVNSKSTLVAFSLAVRNDTENTFSDKFLLSHDLVSNALDNVEARAYMDRRCIQVRRPMIDAGTLGTKGHVQVVIPYISESYSSSSDPQEKSIPLCTIKSYPYAIEHTIEWAMGEFKTLFGEKPIEIKENVDADDVPKSVEECLKTALGLFVSQFSTSIQKLLDTFPPDHVDEDGNPFWTPPKRVPVPISFDIHDKVHVTFVLSCARLFAECYGIREITKKDVMQFLENVFSLEEPNPISFGDTPVDLSRIMPIEFDKDTWHADFVYSAANLRARNYGIKERSKHYIRGVAGRIIPAIATTTAIVSGLATLEIIKYATRRDSSLEDSSTADSCKLNCKNSYLDLAGPFLATTDLVKPERRFYECHGRRVKFTIWSRLEFQDDTLSKTVKKIEEKIGDEVNMISLGSRVIYWNLGDNYKANLEKKISELCGKKDGQLLCYLDVLPEKEGDMVDVVITFE